MPRNLNLPLSLAISEDGVVWKKSKQNPVMVQGPEGSWDAHAVFLRVVTAWYVRQARGQGYRGARCGSVTFVQRFGSSINLNPHFHVLFLDGVYVPAAEGGAPVFVAAPAVGFSCGGA